jgi:hypothetical protein
MHELSRQKELYTWVPFWVRGWEGLYVMSDVSQSLRYGQSQLCLEQKGLVALLVTSMRLGNPAITVGLIEKWFGCKSWAEAAVALRRQTKYNINITIRGCVALLNDVVEGWLGYDR